MIDLTSLIGTRVPRLSARFFPDLLWRMPARKQTAYLTFDDGPTCDVTGRILDLLEKFRARAVFFLVGRHAERDPGLVRAIHEAGHAVGNHTYTHVDAWRTPVPQLLSELDRTTKLLEDLVQAPIRWMRPPYGRFTPSMRAWCLARRQRVTMWDVMPGDFLPRVTQEKVEERLVRFIRHGSIVVLHDNSRCAGITPPALEAVLCRLAGEGWSFPGLHAPAVQPAAR